MSIWVGILVVLGLLVIFGATLVGKFVTKKRDAKNAERSLEMQALLIHLPPSTDDITAQGRDERDIIDETISEAQVIYSIIASTVAKNNWHTRFYRQKTIAFEIVAKDGLVKYYAMVPYTQVETVRQAVNAAYPTARLEETEEENLFSEAGGLSGVAGGEMELKKDYIYPIATYKETKRDAALAILNALSATHDDEGMAMQLLIRPTDNKWTDASKKRVTEIRDGKKTHEGLSKIFYIVGQTFIDILESAFKPPEEHDYSSKKSPHDLTNLQQEEIAAIEEKTKYPGFEATLRLVVSAGTPERAQGMLAGLVSSFSQFDSQVYNGFRYREVKDSKKLAQDYVLREFTEGKAPNILNSIELASVFHLPNQRAIPTSQVERQMTKQVDGPARLVTDGVLIGVNEFRGIKKEIRLSEEDRRRHMYIIGSTGMGKSIFMRNIALQDMMDGRGFAFIDPHGDVVEEIMSMVPPERMDDVIYFDPGNTDNPIGMNMFEFTTEEQKDFIVQEGINMLQSLYDPNNQGFFGARGQHMFRNAALLLMSDPAGATFIDIPQCFIDPEFVKSKLKYVTDRNVYDYWTKEFPASQQSNDAGEVITWFSSKWGPFLANTMMRNILGQTRSGFNIREIMDQKKILLVNLSKGKLGEVNSKLLGMIFVMKFQTAAMSRVDLPESERNDFCLFVDEFQNFSTESFESILSEARKFRLNLIVANQFMTQLTDKIREGVLGNVGTIISGRLGVTDAQLMEKVFAPTFTAEDLHKIPNIHAVATVMMYGVPSAPFTMTWPKIELEGGAEVLARMKEYSAVKYGRPRREVEQEIKLRYQVARSVASQEPTQSATPQGPTQSALPQEPARPASQPNAEVDTPRVAKSATPTPGVSLSSGPASKSTAQPTVKSSPAQAAKSPAAAAAQAASEAAQAAALAVKTQQRHQQKAAHEKKDAKLPNSVENTQKTPPQASKSPENPSRMPLQASESPAKAPENLESRTTAPQSQDASDAASEPRRRRRRASKSHDEHYIKLR